MFYAIKPLQFTFSKQLHWGEGDGSVLYLPNKFSSVYGKRLTIALLTKYIIGQPT